MKGARGVLINITGGYDMTLFEVDEAANRIREEVDPEANIIFGSAFNPELEGTIRVSVVATGIEDPHFQTIEKETKAIEPKPSAIEQMQQLYRAEPVELTKASASTKMEFDLNSVSITTANQENLESQESEEETSEITEEQSSTEENNSTEKDPGVFFSPKPEPAYEQPKTPVKNTESPKSPFSLFSKMANSVGLTLNKEHKEKEVYVLSEDKQIDEEELVTEEMLNIPAYQRRK